MASVQMEQPMVRPVRPQSSPSSGTRSTAVTETLSKLPSTTEHTTPITNTSNPSSSASSRPTSAPADELEIRNKNFRSARYLSMQWASRKTQWSATSSMSQRSLRSSQQKSKASLPPTRLDDSDSDSVNSLEDQSVHSTVSEAKKVLEAWKHRSSLSFDSMSIEEHEEEEGYDSDVIEEEQEEFQMKDNFAFAFAQDPPQETSIVEEEEDATLVSNASATIEYNKLDNGFNSERTVKTKGGRTTVVPSPARSVDSSPRTVSAAIDTEERPMSGYKLLIESQLQQQNALEQQRLKLQQQQLLLEKQQQQAAESRRMAEQELHRTLEAEQELLKRETEEAKQKAEQELKLRLETQSEAMKLKQEEESHLNSELQLANDKATKAEQQRLQAEQEAARLKESMQATTISKELQWKQESTQQAMKLKAEQEEILKLKTELEAAKSKAEQETRLREEAQQETARISAADSQRRKILVEQEELRLQQERDLLRKQVEDQVARMQALEEERRIAYEAKMRKQQEKQLKQKQQKQRKLQKPTPETKLPKQKITWDIFEFMFSFSLLTSIEKAPPLGDYIPDEEASSYKNKLKIRSPLLHDVILAFANGLRQIRSLSNENGKFMMITPDCAPVVKHVKRDKSYKPSKDRQDTVRSLVRLAVPIFVPRDDASAREAAKNVVRGNFAKAISEGNFDEFL
ncbi:hypothetical protein CTEN210_06827 [Chaetoceros tenuissimus]|uniref:Uncharacterized protein n=1 Tax=Chaetoceros tenuissimus TaxID=426638 RepID=A0AAD3CQL0_9STRA|nr:hypothetical protein CTEN210_06827 [Chaetoceros tenuissimus]